MRSATSYFKTLVRSDLRHYWPICFGYTFIWVIMLPVMLLRDLPSMSDQRDYVKEVMYQAHIPALVMAVIFGVIMAMACYSYLMNNRGVGLLHSLPAKRSTHFLAHFASGMGMLLCGNALVFVLSVLVQISGMGRVVWSATLLWLLLTTAMDFIFFAVAIFCAMFTGWLLAVPVLYLGINFVVAAVHLLINSLSEVLYFGFCAADFPSAVTWLTPTVKLGDLLGSMCAYDPINRVYLNNREEIATAFIVYTAAAVVLLGVSYLLYRLRHSEAAGDSVAFRWAKPIFRYVLAILGGLALGLGIYWLIFDGGFRCSPEGLLICLLVMTVLSYFAAEMLISKSLRVFRQGWKGMLAACGAIVLLYTAMALDLFGYEHYLPDASQVKCVSLTIDAPNYAYAENCADEETILAAINAQEAAIAAGRTDADSPYDIYCNSLRLTYAMKDGTEVKRVYSYMEYEKGSALHEALNKLGSTESVQRYTLLRDGAEWSVEDIRGGYAYNNTGNCQLTAERARAIFEALQRDVAATDTSSWDAAEETAYSDYGIEFESVKGSFFYVDRIPDYCTETLKIMETLPFNGDEMIVYDK